MVRRWLSRFEGRIALIGKRVFRGFMAWFPVREGARIPKETRLFAAGFYERFMKATGFSAQIHLMSPN
jgi:hypothetical protein